MKLISKIPSKSQVSKTALSNVLTLALLVFAVGCKSTTAKRPDAGGGATAAPQSGGGGAGDTTDSDKIKDKKLEDDKKENGGSSDDGKSKEDPNSKKPEIQNPAGGGHSPAGASHGGAKETGRILDCRIDNGRQEDFKMKLDAAGNSDLVKKDLQDGTLSMSAAQNIVVFEYKTKDNSPKIANAKLGFADKAKGKQEFTISLKLKTKSELLVSCNETDPNNEFKSEEESYDSEGISLTRTAIYDCGYDEKIADVKTDKELKVIVHKAEEKSTSTELKIKENDPEVKITANSKNKNGDLLLITKSKKKDNEISISSLSNIQSMEIQAGKDFLGKDSAVKCVRSEKPVEKAEEKKNADGDDASKLNEGVEVQDQDQSE